VKLESRIRHKVTLQRSQSNTAGRPSNRNEKDEQHTLKRTCKAHKPYILLIKQKPFLETHQSKTSRQTTFPRSSLEAKATATVCNARSMPRLHETKKRKKKEKKNSNQTNTMNKIPHTPSFWKNLPTCDSCVLRHRIRDCRQFFPTIIANKPRVSSVLPSSLLLL
jgi:hypothetical protein